MQTDFRKLQSFVVLISFGIVFNMVGFSTNAYGQFGGAVQLKSVSNGMSISVSQANGVKTTKIDDNGKKFEIVESEADGITIKLTKSYGPDDIEQLKEDYPDLFMHFSSFPKETEGATVELQINLVKKHTAKNVEELKEKHPEAFAVYEKYSKQNAFGGIRVIGGGIQRIELLPQIELKIEKE